MVVVSNPRHNSSPTTDLPRDSGVVGRHGMCGGTGLSLPLWVTLAKSTVPLWASVSPLVKGKRKGILVLECSHL